MAWRARHRVRTRIQLGLDEIGRNGMTDKSDLGAEKVRPKIPLLSHATADGITAARGPQTAAAIKCDYFCLEPTDPTSTKQKEHV